MSNYLYKFLKQPAALFFKRTTFSSLISAILVNQDKKLVTHDLTIKYFFRPILCGFSAAVKASLVVIYIMVVKNILLKKLEAFIELKASKLKDCEGVNCHVEKNYFKTKFSKRKQPFRGVLLKSIAKRLVNSLKNICEWIHFQRSCRLSACNFTKSKLL